MIIILHHRSHTMLYIILLTFLILYSIMTCTLYTSYNILNIDQDQIKLVLVHITYGSKLSRGSTPCSSSTDAINKEVIWKWLVDVNFHYYNHIIILQSLDSTYFNYMGCPRNPEMYCRISGSSHMGILGYRINGSP